MDGIIAGVIGMLAGAHSATWGMYKDSAHEGFTVRKYCRSIVVGGLAGLAVAAAWGVELRSPGIVAVFFGVVYSIERGLLEVYKSFLRTEDQSKYFIPMQFHVFGRVVRSRTARAAAGLAYVAVVTLLGLAVWRLQRGHALGTGLPAALLVGSLGGWIAAFGGAWKDAPIEGFETFKFFRSPAVALGFALPAAAFTDAYLAIALAGLGYSIAAIETYKTFASSNKPPGKFAGKPILFPEMLRRRRRFVPLYAAIWVLVIGAWVAGLRGLAGPAAAFGTGG